MPLRRVRTLNRWKSILGLALSVILISGPESARAEDVITDLESLVAYLNVNNSAGANTELATLTSKAEITSNPEKPTEAKSVENPFYGSFNGSGIKVVINGKPLFSQLIDARIENLEIKGEILTPDSSNMGALAKESVSSDIERIKVDNVVIQNGLDNTGILVGLSTNSTYSNVEVSTSEVSGNSKIGGLVGESRGDKIEDVKISNSSVQGYSKVGGLVGAITNSDATELAEVKQIVVQNVSVTGTASQIGAVVGESDSTTFVGIEVQNSSSTGITGVGGVVGRATAITLENVKVSNSSVSGTEKVGGAIGESINSHLAVSQIDSSTVVGTSGEVGGFVGNLDSTTVTNVLIKSVSVEGSSQVGGLVGYAQTNSGISNSIVKATVSGTESVGGLAGQTNASVSNVIVIADVTGNSKVGGVVGVQSAAEQLINFASFSGNVSGQTSIGGLVGEARGQIHDAISNAAVNGDTNVGGLVGLWYSSDTTTAVSHLYSDGGVSGLSNVGGLVGELKPFEQYFCTDWPFWSFSCLGLQHWESRYLNFEDIRTSPVVVGNLRVGNVIGSVTLPINVTTNDSDVFSIKYPRYGGSVISVGETVLTSDEPNFRIGMTESKYNFQDYDDSTVMASNNMRIGLAVKKNQTVVFLNSEEELGGMHVFTNWPDLAAATDGIWGQCNSGDLPYLKIIERKDPCNFDLGDDISGTTSPASRTLRINLDPPQSASREFSNLLTKILSTGVILNSSILGASRIPGISLKLVEELNLLASQKIETTEKNINEFSRVFESTLVKGLFFDEKLKPSPETFKVFGITNVNETLISQILDSLRIIPEDERFQIATVERIASIAVIQDLLISKKNLQDLSPIHLLKSGILLSDSRDAITVTRLMKKLPVDQVNSYEKLFIQARMIQQKIELRADKLRQRGLKLAS